MTRRSPKTIDPTTLPQHFEGALAETRWDRAWEAAGTYHWDDKRPRKETFVVDTPPPTVSGSLHMGHVFSYTHTDVITRQRRMSGLNVFYPMGWDDNGLPTERRVQNYFHVRCEPTLPYEPGLALPMADDKKRKDERPRNVSRRNFIELCHQVTTEDEKAFEAMFRRLGLSVDWRQTYATIDDHCRRIAQLSFLDLVEKEAAYTLEAPTMWDVDFQTAVAQAEVEDRERPGAYHHVEFGVEGGGSFVIATTRPELLPACVGVCAHPDDDRYKHLFGKNAVTPIFKAPVRIFPSELADKEKGSGILMVCTFGDQTDVQWWRSEKLPLRQVLARDGRMREIVFGTDEFPSADPDAANAAYGKLLGKNVAQAQKLVVEMLRDAASSATGDGPPLQGDPKPIQHAVRFYEKGDRPLEFVTSRQWFVRLMDRKDALLEKGDTIEWHPEFMRARYRNWTENLGIDWCVSRQRYFGVPIPVWYRVNADGTLDYSAPLYPTDRESLPVDPMSDTPPGFTEAQRNAPGGFAGDPDVFDTWFTSSLTPQVSSRWLVDPARHEKLFPADIRPQSHEIIRTWAFYTIAKALLHEGTVPWHHVVISGWILDPDRKKMSKSAGNVVTPVRLFDEYGADGTRYWAASARLGMDTAFDEKVLKVGKRLVTKIFNASKFVLSQDAGPGAAHGSSAITEELDLAFVHALRGLVESATARFRDFEFAHALMETEQFFWSRLTDTYLELVKIRARGESGTPAGRASAVATLRLGLEVLLRLFAPILPYVTEEAWSWAFAEETGHPSIHRAPWPTLAELSATPLPKDAACLDLAIELYSAINKKKTDLGASTGRIVTSTDLRAHEARVTRIAPVLDDVLAAARVKSHTLGVDPGLAEEAGFVVGETTIAPKEDKEKAGGEG